MPSRPNILLVMSDEHAPQTMGCLGAEWAVTPNLDRLAARGTQFTNAYCNYALCVPSRSSCMSGLLPHRIRAYDIASPLPSRLPTWAHMLRAAGYRCVMNGKMHFIGPDTLHGFHEHIHEGEHRIGGFRWGEEAPDGTAYRAWHEVRVHPDEAFDHIDLRRRDDAVRFLREADDAAPWCLCVGFAYPHYPMDVTESAFAAYDGAAIPEPTPREALHPRNVHWSDGVWGFDRFTPEASRRSRQAYMAMVTMLDGWIGELLGVLEERGTLDETLVVYTSDHGDMWGEHGLWGKNLFYEPSARVPLILSAPALGVAAGERVETPVSLLDLYPTFRDAAGAADWRLPLDGRSLWPAARGETALEDAPVFCEYYGCDTKGPERMVRWKRWKYIYYHDQPGVELYDLAADPDERVNRAGDPACADVEAELHRMLMDGWDPEALARDIREDQNRRSLIGRALQNR